MKNKFKILNVCLIVFILILNIMGCEKRVEEKEQNEKNTPTVKQELKIEDLDWTIEEGVVDGERYVLFSYVNNTPYTISNFEIKFEPKDEITDEEKENYYSDMQSNFEISDDDMIELKSKPISMHTESHKIVESGQSVSNAYCYYYEGYFYVKNIEHYNLVTPDIARISYIDGDIIKTVFYDFKSQKYTAENSEVVAYQWPKTQLGEKVPKPEVRIVEIVLDDENMYMFDAYGMSYEEFNAYVDECVALGFDVDASSFEGFYSADNAEGYNVYLDYDEENYSMSGTLTAPDNTNE